MFPAGRVEDDVPDSLLDLALNLIYQGNLFSCQKIKSNVPDRITALALNKPAQVRFGNGRDRVPGNFSLPNRDTVNQMVAVYGGTPHFGKRRCDKACLIRQFIYERFGLGARVAVLGSSLSEALFGAQAGAAALGFDRVGTLEPGKAADIVLFELKQPRYFGQHDPTIAPIVAPMMARFEAPNRFAPNAPAKKSRMYISNAITASTPAIATEEVTTNGGGEIVDRGRDPRPHGDAGRS